MNKGILDLHTDDTESLDMKNQQKEETVGAKKGVNYKRRCAYCYENVADFPDRKFFRFPKDEALCKKWVSLCQRPYLQHKTAKQLYENYRLCSEHFIASDFKTSKQLRLKTTAYPKFLSEQSSTSTSNDISLVTLKEMLSAKLLTQENEEIGINASSRALATGTSPNKKRKFDDDSLRDLTSSTYDLLQSNSVCLPIHSTPKRVRKINKDIYFSDLSSVAPESPQIGTEMLTFSPSDALEKTMSKRHEYDRTPKKNPKQKTKCRIITPKTRKIKSLSSQKYWLQKKCEEKCEMQHKIKINSLLKEIRPHVSPVIYNFISSQLRTDKVSVYARRWTIQDKKLALQLYLASPKAYKVVSRFLRFPSIRTLQKEVSCIPIQPGFIEPVLVTLKKLASKMKSQNRLRVISFDEVKIQSGLGYNAETDEIVGYENYGPEVGVHTEKLATHALVFMVKGLCQKWKQVFGAFLSADSAPADILKKLVSKAVSKLQDCGLEPVAIVCDMGSNNQKLFSTELEITEDKPYFLMNDKKIYALFDPPHLLKCVRNNLCKYTATFEGTKTADWKNIVEFYKFDSSLPHRLAKKLTKQHVELNSLNKMNVNRAAQVFSESVAAGLYCLATLGRLPQSATYTGEFCSKMNNLFDSVNSRMKKHNTVALLSAVTSTSTHFDFWEKAKEFIGSIKFNTGNKKTYFPNLKGWRITLSAFLQMVPELLQKIPFVMMSRFNQDSLENFFAQVRRRGGNNDHPTAKDFLYRTRVLLAQTLLNVHSNANCLDDADTPLIPSHFLMMKTKEEEEKKKKEKTKDCEEDRSLVIDESLIELQQAVNQDNPEPDIFQQNSAAYIAGYLAKTATDKNPCKDCESLLLLKDENDSNENDTIDQKGMLTSKTLYIFYKEYEYVTRGLRRPSDALLNCVVEFGNQFSDLFKATQQTSGIKRKIISVLKTVDHSWFNCEVHKEDTWELILEKYVQTMVNDKVKAISRNLSEQRTVKRKMKKLQ